MTLDKAGVDQAVKAFYRDDASFPRPGRDYLNDQAPWYEFKNCFQEKTYTMLGHENPAAGLPRLWIEPVEQEGQARGEGANRDKPDGSINRHCDIVQSLR